MVKSVDNVSERQRDWRLLDIFHGYRLLVAITFVLSALLLAETSFFREVD
ncbi:MAG: hypothetical protein H0U63_02315, partial [Burkholderiales bacterium]|nr:hypothetical protein [Burkholderiales bacterium]